MNKKTKFQNICQEIKNALGDQASYIEVLECAQLVMNIYDQDLKEKKHLEEPRKTLDQKSLYEIWEQDPWLIYFKESISDRFLEPDFAQFQYQCGI